MSNHRPEGGERQCRHLKIISVVLGIASSII